MYIEAMKKGNTGIRYLTRLPKLLVEIPTEKAKNKLKIRAKESKWFL
jgi:hypothetical protein